jgi:hypothetical protein
MLAPHAASGHITLLLHHEPSSADTQSNAIRSVTCINLLTGKQVTIEAECFLDATELGDMLAMSEVEHAIGA